MTPRIPTPRQARMLRSYAAGVLVAPSRSVSALVRWGWLETLDGQAPELQANGVYPPLRVSASGWIAVGLATDAGRIPAYSFADVTRYERDAA